MFQALRLRYLEHRAGSLASEVAVFAALLERASAAGEVAIADPADAADALVEATNSLIPYALSPAELGDRAAVERRVARIARLAVAGLLADSNSTRQRVHER